MLSGFYKKLIVGVTGSTGIATVQLLTNSIIPVAPRQFTVMVSIIKSSEIEAILHNTETPPQNLDLIQLNKHFFVGAG